MSNARNLARLVVDNSGALAAANLANAPNPILPGTIAYLAVNTAPTGWLKANGATVSVSSYGALFSAIGSTFNVGGEPAGQFRLPDLRGEFLRGWDDGRGVDSGRAFGSAQSHQMQSHNHEMQYRRDSSGTGTNDTAFAISGRTDTPFITTRMGNTGGTSNSSENRPRNVALLACIKF